MEKIFRAILWTSNASLYATYFVDIHFQFVKQNVMQTLRAQFSEIDSIEMQLIK